MYDYPIDYVSLPIFILTFAPKMFKNEKGIS